MPGPQPFKGIIDLHAHADLDRTRRSLDAIERVKQYHKGKQESQTP